VFCLALKDQWRATAAEEGLLQTNEGGDMENTDSKTLLVLSSLTRFGAGNDFFFFSVTDLQGSCAFLFRRGEAFLLGLSRYLPPQ